VLELSLVVAGLAAATLGWYWAGVSEGRTSWVPLAGAAAVLTGITVFAAGDTPISVGDSLQSQLAARLLPRPKRAGESSPTGPSGSSRWRRRARMRSLAPAGQRTRDRAGTSTSSLSAC